MIEAHSVDFLYGDSKVLDNIDLHAADGETIGLIGPNGSGKSTLLRTLYRSLTPRAGFVTIDETPISELAPSQLAREVSVVVQDGAGELPFTVSDLVLLGRTPHLGSFQRLSPADVHVAALAIERVGIRHLADREFSGLSGGERQRALIARALAQEASHLLLDEPTNHLDIRYQHEILHLVEELDVTTIVVLHDLNLAARYCSRLILLDKGRVVASGDPSEVLTSHILEAVYGLAVDLIEHHGVPQLVFTLRP